MISKPLYCDFPLFLLRRVLTTRVGRCLFLFIDKTAGHNLVLAPRVPEIVDILCRLMLIGKIRLYFD